MVTKITLIIILTIQFLSYNGCGDDGKEKKDADADVIDIQQERDIHLEPEIPIEIDVDIISEAEPGETPVDVPSEHGEEVPSLCNPVYGGECNLIDNCNCQSGNACRLFLNPDVDCSVIEKCAAMGTVPTGGDCTNDSDCTMGNACLTSPVWGTKCIRWCDDDSDCDSGHTCSLPVVLSQGSLGPNCPALTLEYKACDLGCPPDAHCNPITGEECTAPRNACLYMIDCKVLFCAEPGPHQIGEDCNDGEGCVVGSDCISIDGGVTFLCYEFCNSSHQCPAGKTCNSSAFGYPSDPSFGICI